jgi:hypothetical protein
MPRLFARDAASPALTATMVRIVPPQAASVAQARHEHSLHVLHSGCGCLAASNREFASAAGAVKPHASMEWE